jgi:hypothetical protein
VQPPPLPEALAYRGEGGFYKGVGFGECRCNSRGRAGTQQSHVCCIFCSVSVCVYCVECANANTQPRQYWRGRQHSNTTTSIRTNSRARAANPLSATLLLFSGHKIPRVSGALGWGAKKQRSGVVFQGRRAKGRGEVRPHQNRAKKRSLWHLASRAWAGGMGGGARAPQHPFPPAAQQKRNSRAWEDSFSFFFLRLKTRAEGGGGGGGCCKGHDALGSVGRRCTRKGKDQGRRRAGHKPQLASPAPFFRRAVASKTFHRRSLRASSSSAPYVKRWTAAR